MKIGKCFIAIYLFFIFISCEKEKPVKVDETPLQNIKVNEWIYEKMKYYYFWNNTLPSNPDSTLAPKLFFNSLLNKNDRFSYILNNERNFISMSEDNEITSFGFSFRLYQLFRNSDSLIALIDYVWANSPAEKAGLKRGDFFDGINSKKITINTIRNYSNDSEIDLNMVFFNGYILDHNLNAINVKAEVFYANPIIVDTIYNVDNCKIAYLKYYSFISSKFLNDCYYDKQMEAVFNKFKTAGINYLILDLRSNRGGLVSSCLKLSSLLVPALDTTNIFMYYELNDQYGMDYLKDHDQKNYITFRNESNNIGNSLDKLYIIADMGTASASELLINCLMPYIPVEIIGSRTVGKNMGSLAMYDTTNVIKWIFWPLVFKSYNCKHESNYSSGFQPKYEMNDNPFSLFPYGSLSEPLLKYTIEVITNNTLKSFNNTDINLKEVRNNYNHCSGLVLDVVK